jgi:predicted phosphodiesterase
MKLDAERDFFWNEADFKDDHEAPTPSPRLIVVGDVHACDGELRRLLDSLDFDPRKRKDRIILAGDLVAKGPGSKKVAEFAAANRAFVWAVRGNHDDTVVRWAYVLHSNEASLEKKSSEVDKSGSLSPAERRLGELAAGMSVSDTEADEAEEHMLEADPVDQRTAKGKRDKKKDMKKDGGKREKKKKDKYKDADVSQPAPKGPSRSETFSALKPGKEHNRLALASSSEPPESLDLPLLAYLAEVPLAIELDLPFFRPEANIGQALSADCYHTSNRLLIVHAGVIPTIPLAAQDPHDLMYLRSILPRASADGVDVGSAEVESVEDRTVHWLSHLATCRDNGTLHADFQDRTIIFGHDAMRGLQLGLPHALGLDTGAVYGNRLTAGFWEWKAGRWQVRIASVGSEKVWSVPKGGGD